MIRRAIIFTPILIFFLQHEALAQPFTNPIEGDSTELAANPNIRAGWFHRFLFGSLWRDVWTTPVRVKVLHRDWSNNKEYSFTSLEQDSAVSIPTELAELLPRNIAADQAGILNPYTPLIVNPILDAVDIPYRELHLIAFDTNNPDSSSSQRNKKIGFLKGQWHKIGLTQLDSLPPVFINTSAMLDAIENDNLASIDEIQYLKARLIDIMLGNWNRTSDQWNWICTRRDERNIYEPVPLNYQHAFSRLNGLLPIIADIALPQLETFSGNISSVDNLTLTGRSLDRRILISFTGQKWDSLARWIQFRISDSVLIKALEQFPSSLSEKEGAALIHLLKSRRAQLQKAAEEFYRLLSTNVEIHGSSKAEIVEVHRIGQHVVSITIFDRRDTVRTQIFKRMFYDDYTDEIRILLFGGGDIITLEGEESGTIKIIIDGGDGKNDLINNTRSRNLFPSLSLLSAHGTIYYTSDPDFVTTRNSNIKIIYNRPESAAEIRSKTVHLSYRDWGSEWSFSPWFDINPDDGLFIGGGPVYTKYEYRMKPYAQQLSVRAGFATRTRKYRLDASGEFRDWFSGVRAYLQFHASQLDFSNFFGLGNETKYNQSLDEAGFYNVDQRQVFFHAALDFPLAANITAAGSGTLKLIDNNPRQQTLLDTLKLPYYNRSLTFLKIGTQIRMDTRDNKKIPVHGIFSIAEISYFPNLTNNEHSFYKLRGELRTYLTFESMSFMTIACRAIGEKLWGEYPFFESAFLGGNESLRGFERQRFSGDASILGSVEIRSQLTQIPFIVPLRSGISAFAETGRVFFAGEHSNRWHNTIGGGVWISFIKPEYTANLTLAHSEDKIAFYATMGFMF